MKKIILALLVLPFWGHAQSYSVRKMPGGVNCDSCIVPCVLNLEYPLSYVLIDAISENNIEKFQKKAQAGLKNVSTHFISSGKFTLNFLPLYLTGIKNPYTKREWPNAKPYKNLQFSIWQNTQLIKDWTDIKSLPVDKSSAVFFNTQYPQPDEWRNFSAGVFHLNIGDSLIVKIREMAEQHIIQSIYVHKIPSRPSHFGFVQVPDSADLQSILNHQLVSSPLSITDSVHEITIQPSHFGLLGFGHDFKTIEYAWSDNPDQWQELSKPKITTSVFSNLFIYLKKPTPGKQLELLLRYKHQPESIRRIKIKSAPPHSSISWMKITASLVLAFCVFALWYYFKRKKHKKQLQEVTRKKEDIENKLQLLSGQLNPHFLFNSLNAVQSLINKNALEDANNYVTEVAGFMRTVMHTGRKQFISLAEELQLEESYLQLEQKRKPFQYKISNDCPADAAQIEFPPLLLQPVIENSIRHGLLKDKPGFISIEIQCRAADLFVTIKDNGQGFSMVSTQEGQGLALIKKRIQLMNEHLEQMQIQLHIQSQQSEGCTTIFTFKNWLK